MGGRPSIGVCKAYFDLTGTVRWGIGGRLVVFPALHRPNRHSQVGGRPSIGVCKAYFDLTGTVRWGIGGRLVVFSSITST